MTGWLVLGVLAAVFLLYAADRVVKAFLRARRLRQMSERPDLDPLVKQRAATALQQLTQYK